MDDEHTELLAVGVPYSPQDLLPIVKTLAWSLLSSLHATASTMMSILILQ